MNPAAPATYRVLLGLLTRRETTQRELSRSLNVSLGQVNNVFRWLEGSGFVEKGETVRSRSRGRGRDVYLLTNPTGLLRAISLFRPMDRLRRFSTAVDTPKQKLLGGLRKFTVVLCLGTALERYSQFYRSDEISFYALAEGGPDGAEAIHRELIKEKEGITRATCYLIEGRTHGRREPRPTPARKTLERFTDYGVVSKAQGYYLTTKVQTAVDLFCDGKAFAARDLIKGLWQVEL